MERSTLRQLIRDVAVCIKRIDGRRPCAKNARTGVAYLPGIGPHTERQVVELVAAELQALNPRRCTDRVAIDVRYPDTALQSCDFCLGQVPSIEWAVEFKLLRLLGDNGKPNDNMITHILSPYPSHRSAVTDCTKIVNSSLPGRKAIIIYGFDYPDQPMDLAIDAFEALGAERVSLGPREVRGFSDLVHPVHSRGRVFGWEVRPRF